MRCRCCRSRRSGSPGRRAPTFPTPAAPLTAITGRVGSSTVTATDCVWNAAPGPQLPAPHTAICCTARVPAGIAKGIVVPRMSRAVLRHVALGRRPNTYPLPGWASIITPQRQSPRASRPPHRIDEIVDSGGRGEGVRRVRQRGHGHARDPVAYPGVLAPQRGAGGVGAAHASRRAPGLGAESRRGVAGDHRVGAGLRGRRLHQRQERAQRQDTARPLPDGEVSARRQAGRGDSAAQLLQA